MFRCEFLPIQKWLLSLNCLAPFISIPRNSHVMFLLCTFSSSIFHLWCCPKNEGSSSLSQLLTVSCLVIPMRTSQVTMGQVSWKVKKDIYNKGHRNTWLHNGQEQEVLCPGGGHLPFISGSLCRHGSSAFLAVTLTRVFNFTLSHPVCQVITIIFI